MGLRWSRDGSVGWETLRGWPRVAEAQPVTVQWSSCISPKVAIAARSVLLAYAPLLQLTLLPRAPLALTIPQSSPT